MYWNEHPPPHFHAIYEDYGAQISIETGEVIRGKLPPKAGQLVKEWAQLYSAQLMDNWQRAKSEQELQKLPPLE